jgi:hypothetical protein
MPEDEFPIVDYDQLPIGDLRHRIRSLTRRQLEAVFSYEEQHGRRTPVMEILAFRLEQLADGAEPAGADQRNAPGVTSTPAGSPVGPADGPEDHTPVRHGVYQQTPGRRRG